MSSGTGSATGVKHESPPIQEQDVTVGISSLTLGHSQDSNLSDVSSDPESTTPSHVN